MREPPVSRERSERAGRGKRTNVLARQIGFLHQFLDGRKRPASFDALAARIRQAAHLAQAEPQSAVALQSAVPVARANIGRPHLDPVAPRVLHQLRRGIEAHRLAVEKRGAEGRRVMAFQPR